MPCSCYRFRPHGFDTFLEDFHVSLLPDCFQQHYMNANKTCSMLGHILRPTSGLKDRLLQDAQGDGVLRAKSVRRSGSFGGWHPPVPYCFVAHSKIGGAYGS